MTRAYASRAQDNRTVCSVSALPLDVEPSAGDHELCSLRVLEDHAPASLALIVGPEGGWTPEERQQAEQAGCMAVTLGGLTLRADAVATAAIAIARFALRDL